ncbi:MAG TPA: hypothetical protein VGI12_12725 [Vicinamibacterales bacterium]
MAGLLAIGVPAATGQERAPNGQIYRELLPFVGLDGVRVEIHGLGGGVFNIPGPITGDPETTLTGLSRAEHEQLERDIRSDIEEAFRNSRIPLLPSSGSADEVRPLLVIDIGWGRVKPDTITVHVRIDLLEAARLVKDPSRIGWASSWGSTYYSVSSGPDLAALVRSIARGQVSSFVALYVRAHTKTG